MFVEITFWISFLLRNSIQYDMYDDILDGFQNYFDKVCNGENQESFLSSYRATLILLLRSESIWISNIFNLDWQPFYCTFPPTGAPTHTIVSSGTRTGIHRFFCQILITIWYSHEQCASASDQWLFHKWIRWLILTACSFLLFHHYYFSVRCDHVLPWRRFYTINFLWWWTSFKTFRYVKRCRAHVFAFFLVAFGSRSDAELGNHFALHLIHSDQILLLNHVPYSQAAEDVHRNIRGSSGEKSDPSEANRISEVRIYAFVILFITCLDWHFAHMCTWSSVVAIYSCYFKDGIFFRISLIDRWVDKSKDRFIAMDYIPATEVNMTAMSYTVEPPFIVLVSF